MISLTPLDDDPGRSDFTPHSLGTSAPLIASPIALPVVAPPRPTVDSERIITLDVLRGFALFGILLVNIGFFITGMMDVERLRWWDQPTADALAYLFVDFFGSYKFVSLFSMLFGMGIALQGRRADANGRPFASRHLRRMFILFCFGVLHGMFLWYGDILTMYALLGMVAILFRRCRPRTLLIVGTVFFLAPTLLMHYSSASKSTSLSNDMNWQSVAEEVNRNMQQGRSGATSSEETEAIVDAVRDFGRFLDREVELYGRGPWHLAVAHRACMYVFLNLELGLALLGWRCLGMMLFGMALINNGVMLDPAGHRRTFLWFGAIGLLLGSGIQLIAFWVPMTVGISTPTVFLYTAALYIGSLGVSLGYLGIVSLLTIAAPSSRWLWPFAAAGRMALTNYIGQSVILNFIFFSVGFGLIGQVRFAWSVPMTVGIFAVQLAVSPLWLRAFRFGPLEWIWRTLTYGHRQPMLRRDLSGIRDDE